MCIPGDSTPRMYFSWTGIYTRGHNVSFNDSTWHDDLTKEAIDRRSSRRERLDSIVLQRERAIRRHVRLRRRGATRIGGRSHAYTYIHTYIYVHIYIPQVCGSASIYSRTGAFNTVFFYASLSLSLDIEFHVYVCMCVCAQSVYLEFRHTKLASPTYIVYLLYTYIHVDVCFQVQGAAWKMPLRAYILYTYYIKIQEQTRFIIYLYAGFFV